MVIPYSTETQISLRSFCICRLH